MACQARDGDVDQFFSHKNHACPPSLSQGGKLWFGSKADLMPCMELGNAAPEASPLVDATFLDGADVVHMLNPGTAKTFLEYAEQVFYPMYQHSSKIPLMLTLFGMSIKQIASRVQRDKRGERCSEKSCSLGSDSNEHEGFLACGRQQYRTF